MAKKSVKKKRTVAKVKKKVPTKRRPKGTVSPQEKRTIKYLDGFLNKRGGKDALNLLLKMIKVVRK